MAIASPTVSTAPARDRNMNDGSSQKWRPSAEKSSPGHAEKRGSPIQWASMTRCTS